MYTKAVTLAIVLILTCIQGGFSENQTPTVSPIYPSDELPFNVLIEKTDFSLPNGIHSYVSAIYDGKWLLLAGRTNGMHTFNNNSDNFPPNKQNTTVYVVDPRHQTVAFKSLDDSTSGLTQNQIDLLSVTSCEFYQHEKTLYVAGGYGVDTATGLFNTKDSLTAIDIPGFMHWVTSSSNEETAVQHIRQTSNPLLQVTGGYMSRVNEHLTLLVFGQNFTTFYTPGTNGIYTEQVRRFHLVDDGKKLIIHPKESEAPNPNYRRRDLNVVPIIQKSHEFYLSGYAALSGVFTLTGGAWTVPVLISSEGTTSMADPDDPNTFKQGMNNYACPTIGLFCKKSHKMYVVICGGISYGSFHDGVFTKDPKLPFINQLTTVEINKEGVFKQFIMEDKYPVVLTPNDKHRLRFGAGAQFLPVGGLPAYKNGVLKLNKLEQERVLLGYIVGGIQSKVGNTKTRADSGASPHIFKVFLEPKDKTH